MTPFLTCYTPTYQRPTLLARCQASVAAQTLPCQHLIIPDAIGLGIDGMFAAIPSHAPKVIGDYVLILPDDDVLVGPSVAAQIQQWAQAQDQPDVLLVRTTKTLLIDDRWITLHLPLGTGAPQLGRIDLTCVVTRRDVWLQHVTDYGQRYEGDFDHVSAMWQANRRFVYTTVNAVRGHAMYGAPEYAHAQG